MYYIGVTDWAAKNIDRINRFRELRGSLDQTCLRLSDEDMSKGMRELGDNLEFISPADFQNLVVTQECD